LATISERIKRLPLKSKLAWGYTVVFTLLFAMGFCTIYFISEDNRQEEFYQRLKDRTHTTYKILVHVDQINYDLLRIFDRNTINSLYDERIMLFDSTGKVIYNSIDDIVIAYPQKMLTELMHGKEEIRMTDGKHELLALQFKSNNTVFYGIAKAYDRFGKSKMSFLKNSLIIVFIITTCILVFASFGLSNVITAPITNLARDIDSVSPVDLSVRVEDPGSNDEIGVLARKFNELLARMENSFKFQYHFIHHVSHELKTPLSVMMANAESALAEGSPETMQKSLSFQKDKLMQVSHIINAMLDISKTENQVMNAQPANLRVDELLFECVDEISYLYPGIGIHFIVDDLINNSDELTIKGNGRMLKMAFINLLSNAVNYAVSGLPIIEVVSKDRKVFINIYNDGEVISEADRKQLFTHLFRGDNSKGKEGFGLGLVLVQRIIKLHSGEISYSVVRDKNCFSIELPVA